MVIITGLPGTGKTTLASALAEDLGVRHLNTDMIRAELGIQGHYDPESKRAVYQEMLRRAEEELSAGRDVVIDGTFYPGETRKMFRKLARRHDADLRWIELHANEETIRRRVAKERPFSEADFEIYQKIKADYEPLGIGHLVLWSDEMPLSDLIRRAKDYLTLAT